MITNPYLHYSFHLVIYNLVWLMSLIGASTSHSLTVSLIAGLLIGLQVVWQIKRDETQQLVLLTVLFWIAGLIGDGILVNFGWLSFHPQAYLGISWPLWLPPLFMQVLWICFGVTFYSTLSLLMNYLIVLSCLSLLGFALAYYLGSLLGAAELRHGVMSLMATGVLYAFLLPFTVFVFTRIRGTHD